MSKHSYHKNEKLKSRKLIATVFAEGKVCKAYPIRAHFLVHHTQDTAAVKAGFSVSKRYFKNATDRNRIKRLMREAYRHHSYRLKNSFENEDHQLAVMYIYSSASLLSLDEITKKIKKLNNLLINFNH